MKPISRSLLTDLFLSRYKFYRYFLMLKLLQKYFPELQKNSSHIKDVALKNMKNKPYSYLAMAVIAGAILTRLFKR